MQCFVRLRFHPFSQRPSWKAIADKPWYAQWQHLQDPSFRSRLLSEQGEPTGSDLQLIADLMETAFSMQYEMLPGFNYEPTAEQSIEQRAVATGVTAAEYAYDFMMRDEGAGMIYFPLLNYADGNLDFLEEALDSDDCVNSLSDGGAHCGTICDAAATTFMLQHWVRDREGRRMPLERAIKRQCHDTARLYGFEDRGVLAPGLLADLNVIDLESLQLNLPTVAFDLPAGGRRLLQTASGLHHLHSRKVLHRDLKAKNLFLAADGVKIGDTQATVIGLISAALFMFLSLAKPLPTLSSQWPHTSPFSAYALWSVGLQAAIHLCFLVCAVASAKRTKKTKQPTPPLLKPPKTMKKLHICLG